MASTSNWRTALSLLPSLEFENGYENGAIAVHLRRDGPRSPLEAADLYLIRPEPPRDNAATTEPEYAVYAGQPYAPADTDYYRPAGRAPNLKEACLLAAADHVRLLIDNDVNRAAALNCAAAQPEASPALRRRAEQAWDNLPNTERNLAEKALRDLEGEHRLCDHTRCVPIGLDINGNIAIHPEYLRLPPETARAPGKI